MRLLLILIFILTLNNAFSQDLHGTLKVLTYIKGCHGSCNYSYSDYSKITNCGIEKDSIIEIINIFRVNGDYYINGKMITAQRADTLLSFLKIKKKQIMRLLNIVSNEKNAEFIPPRATCFEFEEYQFYLDKSLFSFMILNNDKSENGSYLKSTDIEIFEQLKKMIK